MFIFLFTAYCGGQDTRDMSIVISRIELHSIWWGPFLIDFNFFLCFDLWSLYNSYFKNVWPPFFVFFSCTCCCTSHILVLGLQMFVSFHILMFSSHLDQKKRSSCFKEMSNFTLVLMEYGIVDGSKTAEDKDIGGGSAAIDWMKLSSMRYSDLYSSHISHFHNVRSSGF